MEIEYLREYLVLASERNFTSAASKLFISQSTLSRHISSLEEGLGVTLFERNSRQVILTEAGKAVLDDFSTIVDTYDVLLSRISKTSEKTEAVRVGILDSDRTDFIDPLLRGFSEHHPSIEPVLTICSVAEVIEGLLNDRFDVTLMPRVRFPGDEGIRFQQIAKAQLLALLNADDPLAERESISVRELNDRCFVQVATESDFYDQINSLLAACGVYPARLETATNEIAFPHVFQKAHGVAIVSPQFVDSLHGALCTVPIEEDFTFGLYWAYKASNSNPAVRAFVKLSTRYITKA